MFERIRAQLASQGEVSFTVRVHPGAKRTAAKSVMADGTIKIDVASAPEDGRANVALVRFLAEQFDVPPSRVSLVQGQSGRLKTIRIVR